MRRYLPILFLATSFALYGCGGGDGSSAAPEAETPTPTQNASTSPTVNQVVLKPVGNTLAFETTAFEVKAGETVRLVFENVADSPAMQHNVVILALGTDDEGVNAVGQAAMSAADNDYIPEDERILFYTPLAGPGETVELEFTAPEAGEYTFICTFPGHYLAMKGTMTVV